MFSNDTGCEVQGLEATAWMTSRDISRLIFLYLFNFLTGEVKYGLGGPKNALGWQLSPGKGAGKVGCLSWCQETGLVNCTLHKGRVAGFFS